MALTTCLYYEDPCKRSFQARVTATRQTAAGWQVALDQTCFYPAGGGQPADLGTLGGQPVLDVQEEDGQVWHVLAEPPTAEELRGEIDWQRRFDHMQQHTGQHILSAIALERLNAQTVSFHLGSELVTIDLDVANLSSTDLEMLENEANRVVMEDVPVRSYFVAPEEVTGLKLRKPPTKGERTRIVEVVGIDLSPCGGTHVHSSGQAGMIKVRRLERYKGGVRLEFLCGWRALGDYQWKHQTIAGLARDLSVADYEVEATVRRILAGEKDARRQVETMRGELLGYEAASLRHSATRIGANQLISRVFPERSPAEVKQLASLLAAEPGTVALLAAQAPSARIFFMRSADIDLDMRQLLREVTQKFGGGGGGRPETAEGGGMSAESLTEALAWAAQQLGAKST